MTPLKALVGLVALLFDAFFGKKTGWPDGEQPLIDPPKEYPPDWALTWGDTEVSAGSAIEARVDAPADEVPTPGRAHTPGVGHPDLTADELDMASFAIRRYADARPNYECADEYRMIANKLDPNLTSAVDEGHVAEGFARADQPQKGTADAVPIAEVPAGSELRAHSPAGHPNVTGALRISAAIGLRDYADSDACEAPVYWKNIASQLDPRGQQ